MPLTTRDAWVPQASLLPPAVAAYVAAQLPSFTSGGVARSRAGRDGWGYRLLDMVGRVGVVTYKGVEVALLFRRQMAQTDIPVTQTPGPETVWHRLDFVGPNAGIQTVVGVGKPDDSMTQKTLRQLQDRLNDQEKSLVQMEEAMLGIQNAAEVEKKELTASLQSKVQDIARRLQDKARQAAEEEVARREQALVTELLPLAETLLRARQQYQGEENRFLDVLESMIRKTLRDRNAELLIPSVGEKFDPCHHEAVATRSGEEDRIVQVVRYGLSIGGMPVAVPQVVVGVPFLEESVREEGQ